MSLAFLWDQGIYLALSSTNISIAYKSIRKASATFPPKIIIWPPQVFHLFLSTFLFSVLFCCRNDFLLQFLMLKKVDLIWEALWLWLFFCWIQLLIGKRMFSQILVLMMKSLHLGRWTNLETQYRAPFILTFLLSFINNNFFYI